MRKGHASMTHEREKPTSGYKIIKRSFSKNPPKIDDEKHIIWQGFFLHLCFRMTRIIVVIDVELERNDWHLRTKIYQRAMVILLNGKTLPEEVVIRKTHMKGFRLMFGNEEKIATFLKKTEEVAKQASDSFPGNLHSESNYASIFFSDWPIDKMTSLP